VRPLLALLAVAAAVALLALRRRARAWEAEPYRLGLDPVPWERLDGHGATTSATGADWKVVMMRRAGDL
jgi:hypothetical protein